MKTRHNKGLTWLELIVSVAIAGVAIVLVFPVSRGGTDKARLTKWISNAKQIHLATMVASVDADANSKNRSEFPASWPADSLPNPTNAGQFVQLLVTGRYFNPSDLKVFSTGGPYYEGSGVFDAEKHCGFKIFNVTEKDNSNTIFLTSRNVAFDPKSDSTKHVKFAHDTIGKKGFVVFRKGGDGSVYTKFNKQASPMGSMPIASVKTLLPGGQFVPEIRKQN